MCPVDFQFCSKLVFYGVLVFMWTFFPVVDLCVQLIFFSESL